MSSIKFNWFGMQWRNQIRKSTGIEKIWKNRWWKLWNSCDSTASPGSLVRYLEKLQKCCIPFPINTQSTRSALVEVCIENPIIFIKSVPVKLERLGTMPRLPLPLDRTQVGAHNHTLTYIYFSHVLNEKIDRNFSLKPTQYNFNKIFQ